MIFRKCFLSIVLFGCISVIQAQNNQAYLNYIEKYKDLAIEQMEIYNIPASITMAQGLFESGAGQSTLSLRSNNHFGIKCGIGWTGRTTSHDDDAKGECFRVYSSVRASYEDHSKFLKGKSRYAALFELKKNDYKGWAHGLKKAGYATNPQYAYRLIDIIEKYKLYELDSQIVRGVIVASQKQLASHGITNSSREVRLNNGILMVQAGLGESLAHLAREYGIKEKKLIKYNDLYPGYELTEGEWVYLQSKKRYASRNYFRQQYIVKEGDSMHSISQAFGIRLKSLYKMNKMTPEAGMPKVGTPIRIR